MSRDTDDFDNDMYARDGQFDPPSDFLYEGDDAGIDYDPTWDDDDDDVCEDQMSDVEADADTLASAGWGTDEDYGLYEGDSDLYGGGDDY